MLRTLRAFVVTSVWLVCACGPQPAPDAATRPAPRREPTEGSRSPTSAPGVAPGATAATRPSPDDARADRRPEGAASRPAGATGDARDARRAAEPAAEGESAPLMPLPEYVTHIERIDPAGRAAVSVEIEHPARLRIDTRNVRGMRIERERMPFAPGRSVALHLDGQVFEIQPDTLSVEMRRSAAGEWTPVHVRKQP